MYQFYSLSLFILLSCGTADEQHEKVNEVSTLNDRSVSFDANAVKVQGDFNGDGRKEFAFVFKTKEAVGNPVENGTAADYEIRFSDRKISSINTGCCEIRLINEGDLDHNGADDLSLVQAPMNGCVYSMRSYSYAASIWKLQVPAFLIATGCEPPNDADLETRIFSEGIAIYYLTADANDMTGKLVKHLVTTHQ